ncbi:MAG: hypothetical protein ACXABY_05670 [Candidatus Thorarchaeota archaeon]|jgi:hypothetical protein
MKHYYGYTPEGKLWWTFVHTGGFPADCNLDDPNCTNPLALHLLANYNVNQTHGETLQGIVNYTCPCPTEVGICECVTTKKNLSYCDANGDLRAKPDVDVIISGSVVSHDSSITKYPSQLFTIKLQEVVPSTIPDGETATVTSEGLLESGQEELTFTSGVTNEVTLRAPAQGYTAFLTVVGNLIVFYKAAVKGFATT